MNTKLTLNIDDAIIQQAKKYAKLKKSSLSRLVEDYLDAISRREPSATAPGPLPPITASLLGAAKLKTNAEYKELLEEALTEKYK